MADPQQVLYGDDGKPIPSTALYDDNGKPIGAQPAQGQSHGWLLDNLWNAGERALDIGKGILNASPMGQMQQASDAYNKLQQNPHAFDPQLQSFKQQLGNVTVPQYASALAMNADPTGMVPGEVGLAKQIPSDIANRNVGGAAVNAGLMALPFLEPFLGGKTATNAPIESITPKEAIPEVAPTKAVEPVAPQPTLFDDTGKPINKSTLPTLSTDTELLHGTTPQNYQKIIQSNKFDPNSGLVQHPEFGMLNLNRPYDYSVAGPDTTFLTKENNTWLNSDWANNSRAVAYDTSLKAKLTPDARVVQANSIDDLNKIAQQGGFKDIHDFANQTAVDGLNSGQNPEEITNARNAIQQFINKSGYHGIDINYDDNTKWGDESIPYEQLKAQENPFGGRQVMVFDSSKVKPNEPTSLLEAQNQGEQLASTANQHTPEAISARINSVPGIASGDVVKPSPQQINSAPVDPVLPTDLTIPRPGMATVTRDIGAIPAEFNSFDTTLLGHPTTAPIYQPVVDAESQFLSAESRATQDYAALTKGLNTGQLEDLGRTLNGAETTDAQVQQVADAVKQQVFDPLYNVLPEGTGKFEDYFPHIAAKDDTSYYQQIKNYFLGNKLEPNAENSGAPIFNAGTTASMETPFAKPRTDSLDNIEWNANKVVPLYIHSVLRDTMMSPAVDAAEKSAAGLPDSVMKSLLGSALKNITNFNGEGELKTQWNQLANSTTNGIARAVYDGNLIPHLLHASNLLTQVYPELGEYYTAQAVGRIAKNPTEAFNEVTRNGLISGQQLPWNLKTGMQKFDSISNYGSFIEKLNAAIGYIGSKQRFVDQGMDPATAQLRAMQAARKMNLVTTPATASKVLSSQSNIFGSAGAKIGGLGAKVPTKFAENLVQTMLNAKSNPPKFARTIGTMGALATTVGPSVVKHAGTLLNANPLGAIGKTAFQVFSKAAKGDIPGAILTAIESGKYFIPGSIGIPDTIKFLSEQ